MSNVRDDFDSATLRKILFQGFRWTEQSLKQALELDSLRGADLTGADLYGADLTGADLRSANLSGAKGLTPAMLARARNVEFAKLPKNIRSYEATGTEAR